MNFTNYKRDYILDVLSKRENAVGIQWNVLSNSEFVKLFSYAVNEMENFTDMFTLDDNGELKGKSYLGECIYIYFNGVDTKRLRCLKQDRQCMLRDPGAATIIFTPMNKLAQFKLKELIEETLGESYLVKVINGDETSNSEAEEEARQAIKDHGASRTIFIASIMANRSWSVKEVKNVLLLINSASDASIIQKVGRGLTPWNKEHNTAYVTDFRMSYNTETCLQKYLSSIAIDTLSDTSSHTIREVVDTITSTPKLTFREYFSNGVDPFRTLTSDELSAMIHSGDYVREASMKIIYKELYNISIPKQCGIKEELNASVLANSNIKGDCDKKIMVNVGTKSSEKSKEDLENDSRIQHLAFLLNHPQVFCTGEYEENIIQNEFENMTDADAQCYENTYELDMQTMKEIVKLLIDNNLAKNLL